jgi:hypothetical protein
MKHPSTSSADAAAWRRARSGRMAWALGAFAIFLYIIGLFVPR